MRSQDRSPRAAFNTSGLTRAVFRVAAISVLLFYQLVRTSPPRSSRWRSLTYLGPVFRGGRWIRCVRQRAPRRGTVPQSRQGRAKPLRHEALLYHPIPRRRLPPPLRGAPVLASLPSIRGIERSRDYDNFRNLHRVEYRADDRSRGRPGFHRRSAASSCRSCRDASLINRRIHHFTPTWRFSPSGSPSPCRVCLPPPVYKGVRGRARSNKINGRRVIRLVIDGYEYRAIANQDREIMKMTKVKEIHPS